MMAGRFALAIPAIALAGPAGRLERRPVTRETLPTDSLLFAGLLVGTALVVVCLSCLPALALGPIIEHLRMASAA